VTKLFGDKDKANNRQARLKLKGNWIEVERAPEPSDVFWENLHVKPEERRILVLKTWLATIAVLLCCCFFIFYMQYLKRTNDEKVKDEARA
jgi:hypothetical protein